MITDQGLSSFFFSFSFFSAAEHEVTSFSMVLHSAIALANFILEQVLLYPDITVKEQWQ